MLTSEASVNRSTHVVLDPQKKQMRYLTPVECERLNGFPDNWTKFDKDDLIISDKKRYFFMGNALVVGVIEKMGFKLAKIVENEKNNVRNLK